MKTRIALFLSVILIMVSVPLVAQEQQEAQGDESLFCVTIPAHKIYLHPKGYVFLYRKSSTEVGRLFFPFEWFSTDRPGRDSRLKGTLVTYNLNKAWPRVSIFYNNGEFSHIKLYVRLESAHNSWGILLPGVNYDAEFENADPPILQFGGGS
jgi:hypothetical protein